MNAKNLGIIMALASVVLLSGCSRADVGAMNAWGQDHVVKQYSGGVLVGQWESTGKVENEAQSDGYYFTDRATGKLVVISGTVQITVR